MTSELSSCEKKTYGIIDSMTNTTVQQTCYV